MKRTLFFLIAFCLVNLGFAQEADEDLIPKSVIKFIPFELTESTFMMEWEKIQADATQSWSVGLGLTAGTTYDGERSGFKAEVIKRWYLNSLKVIRPASGRDPFVRGIYGAVFVRGGYVEQQENYWYYDDFSGNSEERTNTRSGEWLFPGVMIGAVRSFWDVLQLELYVGAGVRFSNVEDSDPFYDEYYNFIDVYNVGYHGVAPNIGAKIGIGIH